MGVYVFAFNPQHSFTRMRIKRSKRPVHHPLIIYYNYTVFTIHKAEIHNTNHTCNVFHNYDHSAVT